MYLVDTNVLSAGAPSRGATSQSLAQWMDVNSDRLYLSVITAAEIEDGIAKAQRQGAERKARLLTEWFELMLHLYSDRILPFDLPAARLAGKLSDLGRSLGQAPGFEDLAIAATAKSRGLTILTRNLRHFSFLGIDAVDPFLELPGVPSAGK